MAEKRLLLLRHAKSAWLESGHGDHDRRLTERGIRAATLVGAYIVQRSLAPDFVLCSTAIRARQTWDAVGAQFSNPPEVLFERGLYLASPQALLENLQNLAGKHSCVLMIAHNPGLHQLAALLSEGAVSPNEKFPTGALATFASSDASWSTFPRGHTRLVDYTVPKALV